MSLVSKYPRPIRFFAAFFFVQLALVVPGGYFFRENLREQWLGQRIAALEALSELEIRARLSSLADPFEEELAMRRALEHAASLEGLVAVELWRLPATSIVRLPDFLLPQSPSFFLTEDSPAGVAAQARYHPLHPLDSVFSVEQVGKERADLIEILLPLQPSPQSASYLAHFWLDGASARTAFARIDRHLRWLLLATVMAGSFVLTILGLSYSSRLHRLNQRLEERSQELLRSQRELFFKSKTSALGTLTAHLMHDIKNHLSGVHAYIKRAGTKAQSENAAYGAPDAVAADALASVNHIRQVVSEIGQMLRQEASSTQTMLGLNDFCAILREKCPVWVASSGGRSPQIHGPSPSAQLQMSFRHLNAALLIVQNLVQNAAEAAPDAQPPQILLAIADDPPCLSIAVRDFGPGVPPERREDPFSLKTSTKASGWGLGLGLCAQLARETGLILELTESSHSGSVFILSKIPLSSLRHS